VTRTSTIVTLALLSSILTPVVVMATSAGPETSAATAPQAKVEMAAVTTTPAQAAEAPACTRRVKVVYAGYGEAQGNACPASAELRR
jgi:hypothetical protein